MADLISSVTSLTSLALESGENDLRVFTPHATVRPHENASVQENKPQQTAIWLYHLDRYFRGVLGRTGGIIEVESP